MRSKLVAAAAAARALLAFAATAPTVPAGRLLASNCFQCHGTNGWLPDGLQRSQGVAPGCLAGRAQAPASHDHLFHTLMGLLDVRSALYEPAMDWLAGCRRPAP